MSKQNKTDNFFFLFLTLKYPLLNNLHTNLIKTWGYVVGGSRLHYTLILLKSKDSRFGIRVIEATTSILSRPSSKEFVVFKYNSYLII